METEGRESEIVNCMCLTNRLWTQGCLEQTKEGMHTGVPAQAAAKDDFF